RLAPALGGRRHACHPRGRGSLRRPGPIRTRPMLLAIDIGNTNVVFALYDLEGEGGRRIKARWRIATDPRRTGDEYAVWLMQLLEIRGVSREQVTQIIVSTVVPRALHNIQVLASNYFFVEPLVAGQGE